MREADEGDKARLGGTASVSADVGSSRRQASDATIGRPPVRSASISATSSPGKATVRSLSQPRATGGQAKRSESTRSHNSKAGTSHDTHASSSRCSSSPSEDADAVPPAPPSIVTSSSSASAISHMYASTTADSDSQHRHAINTPSLARSGSGASTIPTSPETELAQSSLRHASYDKDAASTSNDDSSPSQLALTRGEDTDALAASHIEPSSAQGQAAESTVPAGEQVTHLNPLLHVLASPPTKPSRAERATQDRTKHRPRTSLAHRNKPLPVPTEMLVAPKPAPKPAHHGARSADRNERSNVAGQRKGESSVAASIAAPNAADSPQAAPHMSATPSRSTLKSMLTRSSSKLFRSSIYTATSEGSTVSPSSSDTQGPAHEGPASSASAATQSNSRRGSLMPPTTSRSPSPFQQLLRSTRGRPSSDMPSRGGWQTKPTNLSPPLPTSSRASSTTSLQSASPPPSLHPRSSFTGSETPLQKRPSLSFRLSQHFGSVFGGASGEMMAIQQQQQQAASSTVRDAPAKSASQVEDGSNTITAAVAEASRSLRRQRPPLVRMRSQSMGDVHDDAVRGLALGAGAMMEKSASNVDDGGKTWDPESDPPSSEGREGTLSRLAGSLRRRPHPSKIPIKVALDAGPPSLAPSWPAFTTKHRRTQTSDGRLTAKTSTAGGAALAQGTASQPCVPSLDLGADGAHEETTEACWYTAKDDMTATTDSSGSRDSAFSQFEAAKLALALSAGDESVVARMEAAGRSPSTRIAALPSTSSRAETARMSHSRSSSLAKSLFESNHGRVREYSDANPASGHSKDSSTSSGYESATSTLRNFVAGMSDGAPLRVASPSSRARRGLYADSPPSSFNAIRYARLTKFDNVEGTNTEGGDDAAAERRGSEATIKLEARAGGSAHVRRSSASDVLQNTDTQAKLRVSPSPLARTRKLSTPSAVSSRRRRDADSEKPDLTLDTAMIARPSSAMGTYAHVERTVHRDMQRQPTLSIADDLEFLQVLEHVRRDNQDRIKRQRDEAVKHAELARFGLAPRETARKSSGGASGREAVRQALLLSSSPNEAGRLFDAFDMTSAALVESPLSEDGSSSSSPSLRRTGERSMSVTCAPRPSPLELGVGRASGKMRDGAFLNDEDWKKEVKALFVIRELVLTERSYAAYLEALLHAVRHIPPQPPSRRSTTPSLLMTSTTGSASGGGSSSHTNGNNTAHAPAHIVHMRNLLPQLITMSRTLANRIDENPTAAGVGAAFRLVSVQMEATFVAWSGAITEIMQALRVSEGPKGKARGRIGLLGVHVEPVPSVSSVSVPSSPVRARTVLRDDSAKSLVVEATTSDLLQAPSETSDTRGGSLAKRRSTLSSMSPSVAASLRAKLSASTFALDDFAVSSSSTTGTNSGGAKSATAATFSDGRRSSAAVLSPTPRKAGTNQFLASTSSFLDNALSMSPSSLRTSGTNTPSASVKTAATPTTTKNVVELAHSSNGSRKLTAMDVAIMPTQRLPRYLLLLRDLHASTPPQSLSNMRLQRSLDNVHRVAVLCDRASKTAAHYKTPSGHGR